MRAVEAATDCLSSFTELFTAVTSPFATRTSFESLSTSAPRSALLRFRSFVASSSTFWSWEICSSSVFSLVSSRPFSATMSARILSPSPLVVAQKQPPIVAAASTRAIERM